MIIDNCPGNFSINKKNGIFIKSFFGEENDRELEKYIPILQGNLNRISEKGQ